MMKKNILVMAMLIASIFSFQKVNAQSFEEGKSYVSLGYGFGNLSVKLVKLAVAASGSDITASSIGPVFAKYEYGVTDKVGLGVNLAYVGVNASRVYDNGSGTMYKDKVAFNSLSALVRVNFHFATGDKIDPYFGLGAGFRSAAWDLSSTDPNYAEENLNNLKGSGIGFETTFGLRYLLTDMFGLYAEIGIAKAPVQIGVVAKF